mgnify:CR=1 FL=1
MSYSTNSEVEAYIGTAILKQWHDAVTVNAAYLKASRARAAAMMDGYLSQQSETPVITAFDDSLAARLRDIELAIVRFYEASRADVADVSELVRRGYDDAVEWLEKVAAWEVSLKCGEGGATGSVEICRGDEAEPVERAVVEFQIDSTSALAEVGDTGDRTGWLPGRPGYITAVTYRAAPITITQPTPPATQYDEEVAIRVSVDGEAMTDTEMLLTPSVCKGTVRSLAISFDAEQLIAVGLVIDSELAIPSGISGRVWLEVTYL